jgi:hypothetical protein
MFHHAMVDGVSGVDLMLVLHDLTATPAVATPAPASTCSEPSPTTREIVQKKELVAMTYTE